MRYFYAILFVIIGFFSASAQIQEPVKWKTSYKRLSDTEGEISIKATIEPGWHLFSQKTEPSTGIPLSFSFQKNGCYKKSGKTTEPKPHKDFYDDLMQGQARYFEKEVVFKQIIQLLTNDDFEIVVDIEGQSCDDATGICVQIPATLKIKVMGTTGKTSACSAATGSVDPPQEDTLPTANIPVENDNHQTAIKAPLVDFITPQKVTQEVIEKLDADCGETQIKESRSLWLIFLGGFLGGFLALLTPCVFPMIPLTVSFFTKRSPNRSKGIGNAAIYALSIIVIYTALGFIISKIFGAEALNEMATNIWFNLAFFIIFVVFAISFFGAFEITLPSSFVNKVDSASNRGGLIGIFFMAFTLSLVSFSCTGPIIGTLLVEAAAGGSNTGPLIGMFGFSCALALPFALFAIFPGVLQSLPKSGSWLNSVKIVLGFVELALALKFLSNVDMAYHWGFLKRELFLAIWIVIFGMLGLYLINIIKFKSDSESKSVSIPGVLMAILTFSFVFYLIPGLQGAPLRLLSGYTPPIFYSEAKEGEKPCPDGFDCEHDYMMGMEKAIRQNKPVMLDFTGWACANCRYMEENIWVKNEVKNLIKDEYVLVSLYCDDKELLKEPFKIGDRIAKTEGQKWSFFQQDYYGSNSQPLYILLDHKGRLLAAPGGHTTDAADYAKFLQEGLCRFKNSEE